MDSALMSNGLATAADEQTRDAHSSTHRQPPSHFGPTVGEKARRTTDEEPAVSRFSRQDSEG